MKSTLLVVLLGITPVVVFGNPNLDLFEAVESGDYEAVKSALSAGANINGRTRKQGFAGYTPLMLAAYKGLDDISKLLIESGAKVNEKNPAGATALIIASSGSEFGSDLYPKYDSIVALLLQANANVHSKTKPGYAGEHTALIAATSFGRTNAVKLLLEAKSNVNARGTGGETALIVAAQGVNSEIVELLLEAKANFRIKDKKGYTALMWAEKNERTEIVEILKNAGVRK